MIQKRNLMNKVVRYLLIVTIALPLYPMLAPIAKPAPALPPGAALQPTTKPQVPLQPQPAITDYKAAGILPFAVDSHGRAHLLVGIERRAFKNNPAKDYAMDFGGKDDTQDNHNPKYTAAREGAEELTLIYDETPADFKKVLDARRKFGSNFNINASGARTYKRILDKIQQDEITQKPALYNNNNNFYIMYFPRFSYRDVNQLFQNRIQQYGPQIPHDWHEKSQLVWLAIDDVINAIKARTSPNQPLVVTSPKGLISIWPYFADSLVQAYQRGILENLR